MHSQVLPPHFGPRCFAGRTQAGPRQDVARAGHRGPDLDAHTRVMDLVRLSPGFSATPTKWRIRYLVVPVGGSAAVNVSSRTFAGGQVGVNVGWLFGKGTGR